MTTRPQPEPIATVDYTPDPDDWEVCPEVWMGTTTPRYRHRPSGAYTFPSNPTAVRELDYVDGKPVGPVDPETGKVRRRDYDERHALATADAEARHGELRPQRHVVALQRVQTVYVEVEACGSTEASWAAVENAVLTDEQWATGEGYVSSAFWSRNLTTDSVEHSGLAVGPI